MPMHMSSGFELIQTTGHVLLNSLPLVAMVIVTLLTVLYVLKQGLLSIARSNRLIVTRVQRNLQKNDGHVLDIDPAFIQRMNDLLENPSSTSDERRRACKVMSLSTYLNSLEYDNDEATAKNIVAALVHAVSGGVSGGGFGGSLMPILPLLPSHLINMQGMNPGFVARFVTTEFPSMLVAAAAVDAATQLSTKKQNPDENLNNDKCATDSINHLVNGENPGELPRLPRLPNPLRLGSGKDSFAKSIDDIVERCVELGDEPDLYRYSIPIPFATELLPGLCIGAGGISPGQTPREMAKNRLICVIFNRLAANSLALAGYQYCEDEEGHGHHDPENCSEYVPIERFRILVNENLEISTTTELLDFLLPKEDSSADQAKSYSSFIRSNVTSFGVMLCVRDTDTPTISDNENKSGTTTNERARLDYTHIPLACCARTGVTDPETGAGVKQLSIHSGLALDVLHSDIFGAFYLTFYTGVEGFTGFHSGSELLRPWVWESHLVEPLNREETIRAFRLASVSAALANLTVRVYTFPMGGYGGLGVCNDSVGLIENAIKGRTRIFPLLARSDAKCAMITTSRENFQYRFKTLLEERKDNLSERDKKEIQDIHNALDEIIQSLMTLPNDIQVDPDELPDAIDRIMACTMNSPFCHDQETRKLLPKIKKRWIDILGQGTMRKTLDLRQEFKKRSASKWRIDI